MGNERGFAVIGAGDRGRAYTEAIEGLCAGPLVAVCDTDDSRARCLQQDRGYRLWCTSYEEAIDRDDVKVVVICTPAFYHPDVAQFAAERGKHILCEKPMALDIEGARRIAFAVRRNGVQFALGFQLRYSPVECSVRRIVRDGTLGRELLFYHCWVAEIRPKIAMHDSIRGNNGPVVDMLCHWVDLVRWMTDSEPVRVSAGGFTFGRERVELSGLEKIALDTAAITVEYSTGHLLQVTLCWGLPRGTRGTGTRFIIGPHGCISSGEDNELVLSQGGGKTLRIAATETEGKARSAEEALLSDFLCAIELNETFPIGATDGVAALATSVAALQSIVDGKVAEVDLPGALQGL